MAKPRATRSPAPPIDLAAIAEDVRARVRSGGALAKRELPRLPPHLREALERQLRALGLEVTKASVRLPAMEQLEGVLAARADVPLKAVPRALSGVTPAETRGLVDAAVKAGVARRALRTDGEHVIAPTASALDPGDARARELARLLDQATRLLRRAAAQRSRPAILADDLRAASDALRALLSPLPTAAAPPVARIASTPLLVDVARKARRLAADGRGGLASIPALVQSLGADVPRIHEALVEGSRRGWLELQPESSMGRFSAEELALCPRGPGGTLLSWVRPLDASIAAEGDS